LQAKFNECTTSTNKTWKTEEDRERERELSKYDVAKNRRNEGQWRSETFQVRGTKGIILLEGSQDSPARPSYWSSTKIKVKLKASEW